MAWILRVRSANDPQDLLRGDCVLGLGPDEKMSIMMPNDCIYFVEYRPHKTEVRYELLESGKIGKGVLSH